MYHFEKKTLKNLEIFERKKKWAFFEKVTRKSNVPSPKIFFFLKIFLFFWENFGNLEFFFFFFFCFENIYMNKLNQMFHEFLEFKET